MARTEDRRDFLKHAAMVGAGLAVGAAFSSASRAQATPPQKGKSVAGLAAPRLDVVRVGVVGTGGRGTGDMMQILACEGVQVKAVCDIHQDRANAAAERVARKGQPKPAIYAGGPEEFRKLCDRDDIDLVYCATSWEWHVPVCIDAMKKGKHAVCEVPVAVTLDECWQLVDVAEETQKHCMMLENCCYGPSELMALNMVRKGLLGEILHGECAYIHDLRGILLSGRGEGEWRTQHNATRDGNLYPTHGLGPVAQYMNINRGDRFDYISSMSSPSRGLQLAAAKKYGDGDKNPWKGGFKKGDMNTSIIKTVMGKTIMIQHNVSSPRPYDRINLIMGTKGTFRGYPDRICVEGMSKGDDWEEFEKPEVRKKYEQFVHPLWKKLEDDAKKNGGHGGMDYVLNWRLVHCLRNGLPLDIDVYDTAAWSAVSALSEKSVANRGQSVDFPDFTRGAWQTMKPLEIVS